MSMPNYLHPLYYRLPNVILRYLSRVPSESIWDLETLPE